MNAKVEALLAQAKKDLEDAIVGLHAQNARENAKVARRLVG